jgi:hypothetical protein
LEIIFLHTSLYTVQQIAQEFLKKEMPENSAVHSGGSGLLPLSLSVGSKPGAVW